MRMTSSSAARSRAIPRDLAALEFGLSITDPCIGWDSTEALLLKLHRSLETVRR
jgi:3-deoxy-7-phosphoheptulonate synthase